MKFYQPRTLIVLSLATFLCSPSLFSQEKHPLVINDLIASAKQEGDANRGVLVFGSPKFACISCHQIGEHGGRIGPQLDKIGKERKPYEIAESLLFPKKHVKPEYMSHLVATEDGQQFKGYLVSELIDVLKLEEPSSGQIIEIPVSEIIARKKQGTLMPQGLAEAMSHQQLIDVIRFLSALGNEDQPDLTQINAILEHAVSHVHGPAKFVYERKPLHPEHWTYWNHRVNRDRIYDFYTKQAEHFRTANENVSLLSNYPGLDGGTLGHWGNQNEETWADGRWNESDLGLVQSGVFRVQVSRSSARSVLD